jgi:hypothetical protein
MSYERSIIEEALWYNQAKLTRLRERFEEKVSRTEARVKELQAILDEHDRAQDAAVMLENLPPVSREYKFAVKDPVTVPGATADHDRRNGTIVSFTERHDGTGTPVLGAAVQFDDTPNAYWWPLTDVQLRKIP